MDSVEDTVRVAIFATHCETALPILLRIHWVVVGTRLLVERGGVRQITPPDSAFEVPLSPSGQWPSLGNSGVRTYAG